MVRSCHLHLPFVANIELGELSNGMRLLHYCICDHDLKGTLGGISHSNRKNVIFTPKIHRYMVKNTEESEGNMGKLDFDLSMTTLSGFWWLLETREN